MVQGRIGWAFMNMFESECNENVCMKLNSLLELMPMPYAMHFMSFHILRGHLRIGPHGQVSAFAGQICDCPKKIGKNALDHNASHCVFKPVYIYIYVYIYICICIWYIYIYVCVYSMYMYRCIVYIAVLQDLSHSHGMAMFHNLCISTIQAGQHQGLTVCQVLLLSLCMFVSPPLLGAMTHRCTHRAHQGFWIARPWAKLDHATS